MMTATTVDKEGTMNQKFMMPPKKDKDELDALGSLHYTKIIIVAAGVIALHESSLSLSRCTS
jgi:hypothetical protein